MAASDTTGKERRAIAAAIASVVVVVLASFSMWNTGPDGPGNVFTYIGWLLMFLPWMLGGVCGPAAMIVIPVLGFLQFFALFWFFLRKR
jgi:hypothetical protein